MVKGSPSEVFHVQQGVRQGDPLSPLLFVIVIEYLTRLINKALSDGRLELYSNGGVEPILTFVDDIALFCQASTKSFMTIMPIL